jgi:23S rRNA pseudouridine2605 synthase
MIRLNKYLADCGVGARRKCDTLILNGDVSINNVVQTTLGLKIDQEKDLVKVRNEIVRPKTHFEYLLLNKPKGVLTTASDEKGRKTVLDLVKSKSRIYPVGRLDRNSSGLLLLTNDGELAYRLTHPKHQVEKIYEVKLDKKLALNDMKKLESGIELEEGKTSTSRIDFLDPDQRHLKMTIHQGWNRQIRRMFSTLGYEVTGLKRVVFGSLTLSPLRQGEWRRLTKIEITALKTF